MFVTSDTLELAEIGLAAGNIWKECLVCGIDAYGRRWPGYQTSARFLYACAEHLGLIDAMQWASYVPADAKRSREISPKSFPRLIQGKLPGARTARETLLRGALPGENAYGDSFFVGGTAETRLRGALARDPDDPDQPSQAHFIFPLDATPLSTAAALMKIAVEILDVDYGYYFVRDEYFFPDGYTSGWNGGGGFKDVHHREAQEIGDWWRYNQTLWNHPWPRLRDVFELNLLSERHLTTPVEGLGLLGDWITAAPGRGRLEDVGKGRAFWILTDAEMVTVRPPLHHAGLLLSCRERVYRDLPGGGRSLGPNGSLPA